MINLIQNIKMLADEYAHCYSFVGDESMPRKREDLHAEIDKLHDIVEHDIYSNGYMLKLDPGDICYVSDISKEDAVKKKKDCIFLEYNNNNSCSSYRFWDISSGYAVYCKYCVKKT